MDRVLELEDSHADDPRPVMSGTADPTFGEG